MALTTKALLGGAFQLLLFPLALFLAAGTIFWPAGWIFLLLLYSFVVITARMLFKRNPGLLEERMSMFGPNQKGRDGMFVLLLVICMLWVILMPLDAVRFHWSQMPLWLQVAGAIILAGSFTLIYQAFRENSYLTPTVRIQEERGHTVVSTGLYRYIRHPMYAGCHLFFIGMPLLLGSLLGLVLAPILIGLFFRRAVLEERVLKKELPGYEAYMVEVSHRFIPYVW
ncbi:MAG TPA: isoprenylcysteine carboxylmethyltransferase family protein [Ktedonosporobacter sp.]|jgi:protein-S-isoprenylcysteine O-methyltransferase Ste14|nr:isoprenylcysteine carboxylmethyltransferase family protein [Ktedonosporobacter sp.]